MCTWFTNCWWISLKDVQFKNANDVQTRYAYTYRIAALLIHTARFTIGRHRLQQESWSFKNVQDISTISFPQARIRTAAFYTQVPENRNSPSQQLPDCIPRKTDSAERSSHQMQTVTDTIKIAGQEKMFGSELAELQIQI